MRNHSRIENQYFTKLARPVLDIAGILRGARQSCTLRSAVTQPSHHTRAPPQFRAPARPPSPHATSVSARLRPQHRTAPHKSPHTHARKSGNHEPSFGAIAQSIGGGPRRSVEAEARGVDMTTWTDSAISSHLIPRDRHDPYSQYCCHDCPGPRNVDPGNHAWCPLLCISM